MFSKVLSSSRIMAPSWLSYIAIFSVVTSLVTAQNIVGRGSNGVGRAAASRSSSMYSLPDEARTEANYDQDTYPKIVSKPSPARNFEPVPQFQVAIPTLQLVPVNYQPAAAAADTHYGYHLRCPAPKGLFPHPVNCNKFLNCYEDRVFVQNCPDGLHFNPGRLYCDWPHQAGCKAYPVGGWVSDGRVDQPQEDYPEVDLRGKTGTGKKQAENTAPDAV